eukprot:UN24089
MTHKLQSKIILYGILIIVCNLVCLNTQERSFLRLTEYLIINSLWISGRDIWGKSSWDRYLQAQNLFVHISYTHI